MTGVTLNELRYGFRESSEICEDVKERYRSFISIESEQLEVLDDETARLLHEVTADFTHTLFSEQYFHCDIWEAP